MCFTLCVQEWLCFPRTVVFDVTVCFPVQVEQLVVDTLR